MNGLAIKTMAGGVSFEVKVVPGASRDQVVGLLGDKLKVKVAAPPENGKANAAVCRLIAQTLGVAASAVRVVRGASQPNKCIEVRGVDAATLLAKLTVT